MPVIVATGQPREAQGLRRGLIFPVADWLQKPVDAQRLLKAVRASLVLHGRPRVLHVEDDPDTVQLFESLLEGEAELTWAGTVAEARQRLEAETFDLVILDLGLPDGSGMDLLPNLKPTRPVLIFSAQPPGPRASREVDAVLTKSVASNEDLLSAIRVTLSQAGGKA